MKKRIALIALFSVLGIGVCCIGVNFFTNGALTTAAVDALAEVKLVKTAEEVFLSRTRLELTPLDGEYKLEAVVMPEKAFSKKVAWRSDNPGIASVDENGTVRAGRAGETVITASCGDAEAKCTVTVYKPIESITLGKRTERVREGTEIRLVPTVNPSDATDKLLEWISTDEMVAVADADGNVLVTGAGEADIIVRASNGAQASCKILAVAAEPIQMPSDNADPTPRPAIYSQPSTPTPAPIRPNETLSPSDGSVKFVSYPYTFAAMLSAQMKQTPKVYRGASFVAANADEVERYLDPIYAYKSEYMKYQFVDLSKPAGVGADRLNAYLSGKGILSGTGEAFIGACRQYSVNELYLVAHACLETGNGKSKLAQGVEYKGTIVYNMFGIGAYDSDPINGGAKYAYEHGWTTPEKAIYGGARFVSESYINGKYKQNTLYKMLWNPTSPGNHQYATDIGWAVKQSQTMRRLYGTFGIEASFEVPTYK